MLKGNKIKNITDFDLTQTNIVNSISIKKKTIQLTIRFMKKNMLIFAKTSLTRFAYNVIDFFCFPNESIKKNM